MSSSQQCFQGLHRRSPSYYYVMINYNPNYKSSKKEISSSAPWLKPRYSPSASGKISWMPFSEIIKNPLKYIQNDAFQKQTWHRLWFAQGVMLHCGRWGVVIMDLVVCGCGSSWEWGRYGCDSWECAFSAPQYLKNTFRILHNQHSVAVGFVSGQCVLEDNDGSWEVTWRTGHPWCHGWYCLTLRKTLEDVEGSWLKTGGQTRPWCHGWCCLTL